MEYLDIKNWNRREHYNHFRTLADPNFNIVARVNVNNAYIVSKKKNISFFVNYLHACMQAVNKIENFKYRIEDNRILIYNNIDVSATIARTDNTFGFSYIEYSEDLNKFNGNYLAEKERILNSTNLFPPKYTEGCVFCSAIPWVDFTGHKEPFSGNNNNSIPQIAFGKVITKNNKREMSVSVTVNHALMDGYHVGLFFQEFQKQLDKIS